MVWGRRGLTVVAGGALSVALLGACGGAGSEARGDGPSATLAERSPSTSPRPEGTTTSTAPPADPSLAPAGPSPGAMRPAERQAAEAYLASWDAYAEAVGSLDVGGLGEVYDGSALELRRAQVEQHRADGTSGRIGVEHGIELVTAEGDNAAVVDRYLDRSEVLDGATGALVERAAGGAVPLAANLHRTHGRWKVVELILIPVP